MTQPSKAAQRLYRIKPLRFHPGLDKDYFACDCLLGRYITSRIYDDSQRVRLMNSNGLVWESMCNSPDHGKQLAQDDWEERLSPYLEDSH